LEVLRFERERRDDTVVVRRHGRFYGDYPFRRDRRRLGIPRSAFRLDRRDQEVTLTAHLDDLSRDGGIVRPRGRARVAGLDAATATAQRTTVVALRPGRGQALRLRTVPTRLATIPIHRPELGRVNRRTRDLSWSGFEAALDASALCGRHGWREGR